MRKIISCIMLCFLFLACSLPEKIGSIPAEEASSSSTIQNTPQAESSTASIAQWPTEWREDPIHVNGHTIVIDATVETADEERFTYLVYRNPFPEEFVADVKQRFTETKVAASTKYDLQEKRTKRSLELVWAPDEYTFQFESWIVDFGGWTDPVTGEEEPAHYLENVDLTEEDAMQQADVFLQSIGVDSSVYEIGYREKARIIEDNTSETIVEGWLIVYMPKISGCRQVFFKTLFRNYPSIDYEFHYDPVDPPPRIDLFMTKNGCVRFYCEYPSRIERWNSVENQLLDFQSIQGYFKKYFITAMTVSMNSDSRFDPIVQRLILTYSVREIAESDKQEASSMIRPIWVALYTNEMDSSLRSNPMSYVCIDAITGEIVEPVR